MLSLSVFGVEAQSIIENENAHMWVNTYFDMDVNKNVE